MASGMPRWTPPSVETDKNKRPSNITPRGCENVMGSDHGTKEEWGQDNEGGMGMTRSQGIQQTNTVCLQGRRMCGKTSMDIRGCHDFRSEPGAINWRHVRVQAKRRGTPLGGYLNENTGGPRVLELATGSSRARLRRHSRYTFPINNMTCVYEEIDLESSTANVHPKGRGCMGFCKGVQSRSPGSRLRVRTCFGQR